ncbi:hypothetical protein ACFL08_00555 [Patescibacteria group bacterium]
MKRNIEICNKKIDRCRCHRFEAYGNPYPDNSNFLCLYVDSSRASLEEFEEKLAPSDCVRVDLYVEKFNAEIEEDIHKRNWVFDIKGMPVFGIRGLRLGMSHEIDDICFIIKVLSFKLNKEIVANKKDLIKNLIQDLRSTYVKKSFRELTLEAQDMKDDEAGVYFLEWVKKQVANFGGTVEMLEPHEEEGLIPDHTKKSFENIFKN